MILPCVKIKLKYGKKFHTIENPVSDCSRAGGRAEEAGAKAQWRKVRPVESKF